MHGYKYLTDTWRNVWYFVSSHFLPRCTHPFYGLIYPVLCPWDTYLNFMHSPKWWPCLCERLFPPLWDTNLNKRSLPLIRHLGYHVNALAIIQTTPIKAAIKDTYISQTCFPLPWNREVYTRLLSDRLKGFGYGVMRILMNCSLHLIFIRAGQWSMFAYPVLN